MAELIEPGLISGRTFPVLLLRDIVMFPSMIAPFFIGRQKSIRAVDEAQRTGGYLFCVTQRNPQDDDPLIDDVFTIGTLARIIETSSHPDGTVKILTEGLKRARLETLGGTGPFYEARVASLTDEPTSTGQLRTSHEVVIQKFDRYLDLTAERGLRPDVSDPFQVAVRIAPMLQTDVATKQRILENVSVREQMELCAGVLDTINADLDQHAVSRRNVARRTLSEVKAGEPASTTLNPNSLERLLRAPNVTAHSPASDASIRRYEAQYGTMLSEGFKSFLKSSNGLRFLFSSEKAHEVGVSAALADMNTFFGIGTTVPGLAFVQLTQTASFYDAKFIPFAPLIGLGGDFCTYVEISQGRYAGQVMYTDGELFGAFRRVDVSAEPVDTLIEGFVARGWFAPIAPSFSALIDLYATMA